jgi:predicted metal-dependent phosphoesterase TrpH
VKRKLARDINQAFLRYLSKGKPFYVTRIGLDFEQAIEVIHESGGIAILAHPMSLYVSWGKLPDLLLNLKERGLDGIEAWHPIAKVSSCRKLNDLGRKHGLFISAGSDFHGDNAPDRRLGLTAGGEKITGDLLDEAFREIIMSLH